MEFATLLNPGGSQVNDQQSQEAQLWQLTYSMLFLTLSGFVLNWLYRAFSYVQTQIFKKLTCSITLQSKDDLFKQVRHYLTDAGYLKGSMTDIKCLDKKKKLNWWDFQEMEKQKQNGVMVEYLPGPGNHLFDYKGKTMWVSINEQQTLLTGYDCKPTKYETLTITTYGQDTKLLKDLITEAIQFVQEEDTSLVKIYQVHRWGDEWQQVQQKKPRTLESVVLDSDIADSVITDIRKFINGADSYVKKDIPYRRGYLLYGPPGTGKTSFVQVVAAACKLDICYLNLSGGNLNDDALNSLLAAAPERAIILLEDIDAIFVERTSVQQEKTQSVTFSGLLNALDGVRSQEGRILIMTTNHKDKLDPALLRPGRADLHVELNYASEKQMKNLLMKFFPEATEQQAQDFADQLPEFKLSMAKLQGHFLLFRDDVNLAIQNAINLLEVEEKIKEMNIDEWLRRLNMNQYAPKFKKLCNVKYVKDLKYIQEGDLIEFGITVMTDRKRVMEMMEGNVEAKQLFSMFSQAQARILISAYVSDNTEVENVVDLIGEEQITGYQIKDILDNNKDLDIIKLKLYNKIKHNNLIKEGQLKEEIEEETEDKEKKIKEDLLHHSVETFLKEINFEDCIPKLAEHDISDPEIFFGLTEDEMITHLDIQKEGRKYRFKKMLKEIKEKHDKKKAEKEEEKIKRRTGESFELLQKRSTLRF